MPAFYRILGALALCMTTQNASAQTNYPNKPIHMIVPLAAASAVDNAARIVTQRMSINMGQQIVIENMPGASGLIGAKDFEPVSLVATVEWGLVANNNAPYRNAGELIAAAKAEPGKIFYGSGGNGSPQHIAMALFASNAGITLTHVPYKGATQAALDVASGQVPIAFQGLATVASLVRGGKLKLIGVTTPARLSQFPDVPTVAESGLPGFEFNSWFAVMAPAGTPSEIVTRLNAEIAKALADPEVREKLTAQGLTIRGTSAQELGAATRDQLAKYARLIRQSNITLE